MSPDPLPREALTDAQRSQANEALFAMQGLMSDVAAAARGGVAELVSDGFTPDQARAIVATQFGWQAQPPAAEA